MAFQILQPTEDLISDDDEEYSQRQSLRYAMVSLKKYFEAHLAIRCEQFKRYEHFQYIALPL